MIVNYLKYFKIYMYYIYFINLCKKNKICKFYVFENVKMYVSIYMYVKLFDINFF